MGMTIASVMAVAIAVPSGGLTGPRGVRSCPRCGQVFHSAVCFVCCDTRCCGSWFVVHGFWLRVAGHMFPPFRPTCRAVYNGGMTAQEIAAKIRNRPLISENSSPRPKGECLLHTAFGRTTTHHCTH